MNSKKTDALNRPRSNQSAPRSKTITHQKRTDLKLLPGWQTQEVPRIFSGDQDHLYIEYISKNRPALIEGLTDNWPARKRWTFPWLLEHHGHTPVPVLDTNALALVPDQNLRLYWELLQAGRHHHYLIDWTLVGSELLQDLGPIEMSAIDWLPFKQQGPIWPSIYLGPKGSHTGLHIDAFGSQAWNTVIWGEKLFVLISPQDLVVLEQAQKTATQQQRQALRGNLFYQSADDLPGIEHIKPMIAFVAPGDMIYTPRGWLHTVINLELTLAVTHNWLAECCAITTFRELDPSVFQVGFNHAMAWLDGKDCAHSKSVKALRRASILELAHQQTQP